MIEDVIPLSEIAALEADIDELLDTAPPELHGTVDKHGRPSPFGGYMQVSKTGVAGLINHPLMMLDSALTTYGHPDILSAVAAINGPDFIAMNEGIFHKAAHEGVPTGWHQVRSDRFHRVPRRDAQALTRCAGHQDGRSHWAEDGASLAQGRTGAEGFMTHGLNLSVCVSPATPESGVRSSAPFLMAPWALLAGSDAWCCSVHSSGSCRDLTCSGGWRHGPAVPAPTSPARRKAPHSPKAHSPPSASGCRTRCP